jgi:HEAT repeat protein
VGLLDDLRAAAGDRRLQGIAHLSGRRSANVDELAALVACLDDERRTVQRRAADALIALAEVVDGVRTTLDEALRSPSWRQRWGAAFVLARLGAPLDEMRAVLFQALGIADGDVRWAAADIVVTGGPVASVIVDLVELVGRGNGLQRKMALYCLRDLSARTPEVEAAVLRALDDPDLNVRLAAVTSLARLATDRVHAARRLTALLATVEAPLRRGAAAALGVLGERSTFVLDALREAQSTDDAALHRAVRRSLRLLAGDMSSPRA